MRQLSQQEIAHVSGGAPASNVANSAAVFLVGIVGAIVNLPLALVDPFYYFGSLFGLFGGFSSR